MSKLVGWVILAVVVIVVLQSGATNAIVGEVATSAVQVLRQLLIAAALPTILAGAVVAISPKHRSLGIEIAIGGVVALAAAVLAPAAVQTLQGLLTQTPIPGGTSA
ncbi:MAG: hypothetical protein ACREOV_11850 [Candidatus Dormibacteraceae bacterium]